MTKSDVIISMAQKNSGTVTTEMLQELGIARQYLKDLVNQGILEHIARGVYILVDAWEDEFVILQTRFRKGIFSKETALFIHDLTDRTPIIYGMTFPENYNLTRAKNFGIVADRVKKEYYNLGIEQKKSPLGNRIKVYSAEKTLCDILRPHNNVERGVIVEAFKRYIGHPNKNIPLLSEYSKKLKVEEKMRSYLEVLL